MDIDWDELEARERLKEAARLLKTKPPREALWALTNPLAEVLDGDVDGDSLASRLAAAHLLTELVRQDTAQAQAGAPVGSDTPPAEALFEIASDGDLGPAVAAAADALLEAFTLPDIGYTPDDLVKILRTLALTPAQVEAVVALAREHTTAQDSQLGLWVIAARHSPEHEASLVQILATEPEAVDWIDVDLLTALVAMGPGAAPFLSHVAERAVYAHGGARSALLALGEPLLPHLRTRADPNLDDVIASLEAPGSDPGARYSSIAQVCSGAARVWPVLLALLSDRPHLADPGADETLRVLDAVAYSGRSVGALMPLLVKTAAAHERWLTMLALGEAALPCIAAMLEEDDAEEVGEWLEQVAAALG